MEVGMAEVAAGAAGAAGMGLFSYNRGNYMMDQKLHFSRYTAGLSMAIAQTGMYRQDITQLTNLTCARMDVYHSIAAMTATILTALFCPGRLGLHTPPPPGWLVGLFMVNLAGCYLWLGLTMWLCMHASLRADSALTHMLTRFVRVPVPAQWMIDRARKFLSSYEEQPLSEVLRIPFMRHRGAKAGVPYNEDMELDPDAERRTRHGHDVPAWYRKERDIDLGEPLESMLPLKARNGGVPEHFEVYREIQNEWWPYDVYARLSIFLAFMHLAHCWTYMQIGHHLTETRSVFGAACVVLPVSVLQQLILTLDIIPNSGEIPLQRLGPCAQWFAYVAAALEYKRWFSPGAMTLSFVLVYIAYAIHVIYTLQLLRLCSPDLSKAPGPAEAPGASWWPEAWCLPSAFQHSIWLVAPPTSTPGVNDLAGELRAASQGDSVGAGEDAGLKADPGAAKRADVHRALGRQGESPAWFNVKTGLIAMVIAWVFLIVGYSIEVANQGTNHPSLISAPGMPHNSRDPRYRKPKVGSSEPTEVGTGGAERGPAVGLREDAVERRLQALGLGPDSEFGGADAALREEIADRLRDLLPYLDELAAGGNQLSFPSTPLARAAPAALPSARATKVQWPALFEPRLLACGPEHDGHLTALALSRQGRGIVISAEAGSTMASVSQFTFEGIAALGPLVAASWDAAGLLLASATGMTVECPGHLPPAGRWRCRPILGAKLPIGLSGKPFKGLTAIQRQQGGLRAAVLFPGDSTLTLFSRKDREAAPWLPAGEARVSGKPAAVSLAPDHALVMDHAGGAVTRMRMEDGILASAADSLGLEGHTWQAMCGRPSGGVVRLALGQSQPMLLVD